MDWSLGATDWSNQRLTLAGQQWPVVSTVETMAGTRKSMKVQLMASEQSLAIMVSYIKKTLQLLQHKL